MFSVSALPRMSPSAPLPTDALMVLQARETTSIRRRSSAGIVVEALLLDQVLRQADTFHGLPSVWLNFYGWRGGTALCLTTSRTSFDSLPCPATCCSAFFMCSCSAGRIAAPAVHRARQAAGDLRVEGVERDHLLGPESVAAAVRGVELTGLPAQKVDTRLRARFGLRSVKALCCISSRTAATSVVEARPASRTTCRPPGLRPGTRRRSAAARIGARRRRACMHQRRQGGDAVGHVAGLVELGWPAPAIPRRARRTGRPAPGSSGRACRSTASGLYSPGVWLAWYWASSSLRRRAPMSARTNWRARWMASGSTTSSCSAIMVSDGSSRACSRKAGSSVSSTRSCAWRRRRRRPGPAWPSDCRCRPGPSA
jgi:hypothetical protein